MAIDNNCAFSGNVTRDPEIKYTTSGTAIATFGVAWNRRWKNTQGEQQEQTSFFDVKCWSQLGENVAESIRKGDRVMIVGWMEQRSWETDNGDKRSKIEIVADEVGPSLKWATVPDIIKNEKPQDLGDRGGRSSGRSSGGRSSSSSRGSGDGGSRRPAPSSFADDEREEPF